MKIETSSRLRESRTKGILGYNGGMPVGERVLVSRRQPRIRRRQINRAARARRAALRFDGAQSPNRSRYFVSPVRSLLRHLGAKAISSPRCESTPVRSLFRHLAADLAAGIGGGVDVHIILAGHQIGCLGVRQRGVAFGRT